MAETAKPRRAPARSGSTKRPTKARGSYGRGRSQSARPTHGRRPTAQPKTQTFTAPSGDKVRVIVLGGLEEVGRNCTLIEYKDDIIVIDMGLQFPEEDMPGIDYIIPNMSYLKGKEKNVRGVIITHGHYDHIGAIPHTVPRIGNPPIFALPIAAGIIKKRQEDYKTSQINLKNISIESELQLGVFKVHFLHINHNIPDSAGIVVETPAGTIVHTGDWKYDFHPVGSPPADLLKMAEIGKAGCLLLMGDSTNANRPGHQVSEKVIGEELERIIEKAPGRIIVGTFASLLSRVKQILEISERLGRKVAIDGYSMKTNVEIARALGYIKVTDRTLIPMQRVKSYPDEKIMIVCTGAQGEKNAALNRIASDNHRFIKVKKGDTVIFSSSVVPGNEGSVQRLQDTFYRKRAKVIHKDIMDVHAGGHAKKEDIKLMLSLFKPQYYMPIEGNHFLLRENQDVALSMGWEEKDTFVADNGQVIELWKDKNGGHGRMTKEKVPTDYVFVDGLGVGDVSQVVLRDRQELAEDGIIVAIVQVEKKTGRVIGTPDVISRGFVHMSENRALMRDTRDMIKKLVDNKDPKSVADTDYIKTQIRDELGQYLFKKTERRPMVIPVVMEV
jgi:ribonuclease J